MSDLFAPAPAANAITIASNLDLSDVLIRRWWGTVVDIVVLCALLLVLGGLQLSAGAGDEAAYLLASIWFACVAIYFPVMEGVWGCTVGKMASGMIVVDATGRPPGVWKAFVRTIFRLFEVNPLLAGGIPVAIAVSLSKRRQRLGDMIVGTYVIPIKQFRRLGSAAGA